MEELMEVYKKGAFNITEIHCDNEFFKMMDPFTAKQDPQHKNIFHKLNKIITSFNNASE